MILKKTYLFIFSIFFTNIALAETAGQILEINATVVDECAISANNVNFGNYNLLADDASTTISVKCTNGTPYAIGLDKGNSSNNLLDTRKMVKDSNVLNYNLYKDPEKKQIWGETINNTLVGDGNGDTQLYTIYGQIFPDQNIPMGDYSDIVHITLSWGSSNPTQANRQETLNYQISLRIKILAHKK